MSFPRTGSLGASTVPEAHSAGRLFWHKVRLQRGTPFHHRFETYEYEPPFRSANSHILRVFRSFGVVAGIWGPPMDEEEANMAAVQGSVIATNEDFEDLAVEVTAI